MQKASTGVEKIDKTFAPATTPEARENQLIALAEMRAEEQLRNGTAPASIICHFLQRGTQRERLERQKLEDEVKLLRAKKEAYDSAKRVEALYTNALKAMRSYKGEDDDGSDPDIF